MTACILGAALWTNTRRNRPGTIAPNACFIQRNNLNRDAVQMFYHRDLISDKELEELAALDDRRTPGAWHFVDQPWWNGDGVSYVVAGHADPHLGAPVLDGIQTDIVDGEDEEADRNFELADEQSNVNLCVAAAAVSNMRRLINTIRVYRKAFQMATFRLSGAESNQLLQSSAQYVLGANHMERVKEIEKLNQMAIRHNLDILP